MQLFTSFWMIAEAAAVAGNAVVVPCSPGKKKGSVGRRLNGRAGFLARSNEAQINRPILLLTSCQLAITGRILA